MTDEPESAEQRRARFRQWAIEETDPEYRHAFLLASLTPRQRIRRWWWIWWPMVTLLAMILAVLIGLGVWIA